MGTNWRKRLANQLDFSQEVWRFDWQKLAFFDLFWVCQYELRVSRVELNGATSCLKTLEDIECMERQILCDWRNWTQIGPLDFPLTHFDPGSLTGHIRIVGRLETSDMTRWLGDWPKKKTVLILHSQHLEKYQNISPWAGFGVSWCFKQPSTTTTLGELLDHSHSQWHDSIWGCSLDV